jgi:hypothetical protein
MLYSHLYGINFTKCTMKMRRHKIIHIYKKSTVYYINPSNRTALLFAPPQKKKRERERAVKQSHYRPGQALTVPGV